MQAAPVRGGPPGRAGQHPEPGRVDEADLSRSKTGLAGDLLVFRVSGGMRVFVDQSVQDGSSTDLLYVYAGHGGARSVRFAVGDALGDALVRPGRIVVRLVLGQDGAQMPLTEDQHPVEKFSAQGADEALSR